MSVTKINPLDVLEEKWQAAPGDVAEWERRTMRALHLARVWRENALRWEDTARKEASCVR